MKKKKSKKIYWIIGIFLLIAVLGFVFKNKIIALFAKKTPEKKNGNGNEESGNGAKGLISRINELKIPAGVKPEIKQVVAKVVGGYASLKPKIPPAPKPLPDRPKPKPSMNDLGGVE